MTAPSPATGPSVCPPADELERFVADGGSGSGADALRNHLKSCQACREHERQVRENLEFMHGFLGTLGPNIPAPEVRTVPEDILPGYRLTREIAPGGQGVVYEGVQAQTKRRVAVKVIEPGKGARAGRSRRRVEREAEIAAGLRHPNIVTVYESAPLPDGRYALAMEFVEGVSLDDWARTVDQAAGPDRVSQREAVRVKLRAVSAVCDAVQYAHQNGVIHRDLKPANVLVDERGVPRVVDFGVARRIEAKEDITRAGEFAGTLAYASPEQVSGDSEGVDTRSDVYSLGVILYEVLAARKPYETERSLTGAILSITKADPDPLGPIQPGRQSADDELETIVRRSLAKDRAERYQTAGLLRADIENYLAGRAVEAKRDSTLYVLRKAASRHRAAFAVIAGFVILLAAFAIAMAWSASRLGHQRALLASSLSASTVERGRLLGMNGANARAEELIWPELVRTGANVADPGIGFASSPDATQAAWALFEVYSRHPSLMHVPTLTGAETTHFEQGGKAVRTFRADGSQELRRIPDGDVIETLPARFDPRGGRVKFNTTRPIAVCFGADNVRTFDFSTGLETALNDPLFANAWWADVNADGSRVLTTGPDGVLRLWQVEPLRQIGTLASGFDKGGRPRFSEDGATVAAGEGPNVRTWSAADGSMLASWVVPADLWTSAIRPIVNIVRVSPDGRRLAASLSTWILIYRTDAPGAPPTRINAHRGFVNFVGFSADSSVLLSSGHERDYRVWNPGTGEMLASFEQSVSWRGLASIADDGSLVAVCDADDGLRVWETRARGWLTHLRGAENSMHCIRFSPDGQAAAACSADGSVRAWRVADRSPLWTTPSPGDGGALTALCYSPDGRTIATADEDGVIRVRSAADGGSTRTLARGPSLMTWVGYTPDGLTIAAAGGEKIHFYDAVTGAHAGSLTGHTSRVVEGSFSPDGRRLATAGTDSVGIVWDLARHEPLLRLVGHAQSMRAVCYSPDGRTIATGSDDWTIRLWDAQTGACINVLHGAKQHVFGLAFHPSGNVLFSCCRDPVVQAWDTRTGRELATLEGHERAVMSIAISPDGRTLGTASEDRTAGLWDLGYYQTYLRANAPAWVGPARR